MRFISRPNNEKAQSMGSSPAVQDLAHDETTQAIKPSPPLPSFRNAPLREVALLVQFESLPDLTTAHAGLFWHELRDRLPIIEEQLTLPTLPVESAEVQPAAMPVEINVEPTNTRTWLMSADGRELVQLQHDRFIRNWRFGPEQASHPCYERRVRPCFQRDFLRFLAFVEAHGLGDVQPVQCEVAYFNHIRPAPSVWGSPHEMHEVFATLAPSLPGSLPLAHETSELHQSFAIVEDGEFRGRLYTEVAPVETDGQPSLRYHLNARGHPSEPTLEGVVAFLDLGRRLIVEHFAASTTPAMHEIWQREH